MAACGGINIAGCGGDGGSGSGSLVVGGVNCRIRPAAVDAGVAPDDESAKFTFTVRGGTYDGSLRGCVW
jgi:hypothetical protein